MQFSDWLFLLLFAILYLLIVVVCKLNDDDDDNDIVVCKLIGVNLSKAHRVTCFKLFPAREFLQLVIYLPWRVLRPRCAPHPPHLSHSLLFCRVMWFSVSMSKFGMSRVVNWTLNVTERSALVGLLVTRHETSSVLQSWNCQLTE